MTRPLASAWTTSLLLAVVLGGVYWWRFAESVTAPTANEVVVASQVQDLARAYHGGDAPTPFAFSVAGRWRFPLRHYVAAALTTIGVEPVAAVRCAGGIMVVVSVVLVSAVVSSLLATPALAIGAGLVFGVTPVVVRAIESGDEFLFVLPFLAGWLFALERWRSTKRSVWLTVCGLVLAAGLYSHPAAVAIMSIDAAVTAMLLFTGPPTTRPPLRSWLVVPALFLAAAVPLAWALARHPQYYVDNVIGWNLYDAARFNPLQGFRELTSWVGLTARSEVYWDYLSPGLLFFSNHAVLRSLTHPDVFFVPFLVLVPVGLVHLLDATRRPTGLAVAAGFLLGPLVPALTAQRPVPSHLVVMAPFAVVLAAQGTYSLLSGAKPARAVAWVALVALAGGIFLFLFQ